ncbi:phosphoribosyl 1,2-cyclic phosphate phosphodiesterase [Methylacidimicrobium cyclopophantes]|uniref:Phosphoribosyl 1,2-cyclic phosphate phosphodiesterase n=1 Tax=Methylacidimicrobium cyclopophantes TaxID=1041766 RepID=A0A5E6MAV8_9BACT|nr:MBL fold metallo-hydrolase [Methylacidimicrobium cyclopophantes]VVM06692.1 phosphoribosyl 1,2-cyclic phosphate phosphodiesterase [Methylacidimicrobium cyclopophantes]
MARSSPPPLRALVLGSGTSQGVPMIGCRCPVCLSSDPRDSRTRASLYVDDGTLPFLIDTAPDLRLQCLREGISDVGAVLYTHHHADHVLGLDDLRRFCELRRERLPIYGPAATLEILGRMFPYAFDPRTESASYVRLSPRPVQKAFPLGTLTVTPLPVPHGRVTTFGYLLERQGRKLLAYLSDCEAVPDNILSVIHSVEILIIDGLRDEPHPTHLTAQQAVKVARLAAARQTYLTHLTHHKSHRDREADLPAGIGVAFDGLAIVLDPPC